MSGLVFDVLVRPGTIDFGGMGMPAPVAGAEIRDFPIIGVGGLFAGASLFVFALENASPTPPSPPPPPPPPPPISPTRGYGFDAGPGSGGFGKWFNAIGGGSRRDRPRPAVRHSDVARMLDELVYGEEDRLAREALEPEDAEEVEEIVRDAARVVAREGSRVETEQDALALVAPQVEVYATLLNMARAEAWRLFVIALARQAREDWEAAVLARIRADDDDMMILMELGE